MIPLAALEGVIDASGAAARTEAAMPIGVRARQLECVRYFVRGAFRCPVPGVYP